MQPDHLCVLVHGLWGNPSHMDYISSALRERYGEDGLLVHAAQRNAGSFTYDGIELGGERVAHEIEELLEALESQGDNNKITKLSVVGYSLGGLVARYAVGLLGARGWLDKLEPINFTTFASPHVGVRTPLRDSIPSRLWNALGARTLSMSGQQLFLADSFRHTGRPLLSVLAEPQSIFMQALGRFRNRCLYANIVNDRSTVFYTTAISTVDPFQDIDNATLSYVRGYEPVVIDYSKQESSSSSSSSSSSPSPSSSSASSRGFRRRTTKLASKVGFWFVLVAIVPLAVILFLLNSAVQTVRSRQRIRLHEEGKTGVSFDGYRVPLVVEDMQHAVEEVFENVNARQDPEYLAGEKAAAATTTTTTTATATTTSTTSSTDAATTAATTASTAAATTSASPILALAPVQFDMVKSLNTLGFRKYAVHIHNSRHSHAAIIVRKASKRFEEGKLVVRHWLDREFAL